MKRHVLQTAMESGVLVTKNSVQVRLLRLKNKNTQVEIMSNVNYSERRQCRILLNTSERNRIYAATTWRAEFIVRNAPDKL